MFSVVDTLSVCSRIMLLLYSVNKTETYLKHQSIPGRLMLLLESNNKYLSR